MQPAAPKAVSTAFSGEHVHVTCLADIWCHAQVEVQCKCSAVNARILQVKGSKTSCILLSHPMQWQNKLHGTQGKACPSRELARMISQDPDDIFNNPIQHWPAHKCRMTVNKAGCFQAIALLDAMLL